MKLKAKYAAGMRDEKGVGEMVNSKVYINVRIC